MGKCFVFAVSISLIVVLCAHAGGKGTRIEFIQDTGMKTDRLEACANLIAETVMAAERHDHVGESAMDGKSVFSFSSKERNRLKAKKAKNMALDGLRRFYLPLIKSPRKSPRTDVAGALKRAFDRFNAEEPKERYVLVILSSGLHSDKYVSFEGCYPSDSWVRGQGSPFAGIPSNQTDKIVEVIFVIQSGDFANTVHAAAIERFYALLMHSRRARLIGFTDDLQTAKELIKRGSSIQKSVPELKDPNGKLILYKVDRQTSQVQKAQDTPSVSVEPVPKTLNGAVLSLEVEQGSVHMWASLTGPQNPSLEGIRAEDIEINERINGRSRQIPSDQIRLSPKSKTPISVALVRDISVSMDAIALRESADAIKNFVLNLGQDDMWALISFNYKPSVVQNFCSDKTSLEKALRHSSSDIGTAVYDSLFRALELLEKRAGRKCLLAYTDGIDNSSRRQPEHVVRKAKQSSVPIFLIGVGAVEEKVLRKIAEDTGGSYFPATNSGALQLLYSKLSSVINNSCLVSFPTQAKPGDDFEVDASVSYQRGKELFQGKLSGKTKIQ